MPRRTKSISLLLVATALSLTGNVYAEIAPVKPGIDFSQQDGKVTGTVQVQLLIHLVRLSEHL